MPRNREPPRPPFWPQILLLVAINAFVGGMVGLERTLLPLLAEADFGIASAAAAFSFIISFGLSKAFTNLFAGRLADRFGRRRVLLAGWLLGIPVPLLVVFAPSWGWVVAANALLGVNQGLCWSMTVNMKLDRASSGERGLVVGLNEAAGYLGLAAVAFLTGFLAVERASFLWGVGIALVGLGLSSFAADATPSRSAPKPEGPKSRSLSGDLRDFGPSGFRAERAGAAATSLRNAMRDRRLFAPSFAGLATNLKDGALWGLLPLLLAARGLDVRGIALIVAAYPVAWGLGQLVFGPLSDRVGRRPLAVGGLAVQSIGALALAFGPALPAAILLGLGTAMAYPTLLALVADIAPAHARATSLGVYRFWRDAGYAVGALGAGIVADAAGMGAALVAAAAVLGIAALALLAAVPRKSST